MIKVTTAHGNSTQILPYLFLSFLSRNKSNNNNKSHKPFDKLGNSSGFSLTATLTMVTLIGILCTGILSLITHRQRDVQTLQQQISRMNVEYFITQTLTRSHNCSCQFEGHNIQTLRSQTDDHLIAFKNGCNSSADVIVEETKKALGGGTHLLVKEVKLTHDNETGLGLKDIGNDQYIGDLTVTYEDTGLVRALKATKVPLVFQTDDRQNIVHCWGRKDYSCYTANADSNTGNTLVGCGGTSDVNSKTLNGGTTTTQKYSAVLGYQAGVASTGERGLFIGYKAGEEHQTGDYNIVIGSGAGRTLASAANVSHQLVMGSPSEPEWLRGIIGSNELIIDDQTVATDADFEDLRLAMEKYRRVIAQHTHPGDHSHCEPNDWFCSESCSDGDVYRNCRNSCGQTKPPVIVTNCDHGCSGGSCSPPPPPQSPPIVVGGGPGGDDGGETPNCPNSDPVTPGCDPWNCRDGDLRKLYRICWNACGTRATDYKECPSGTSCRLGACIEPTLTCSCSKNWTCRDFNYRERTCTRCDGSTYQELKYCSTGICRNGQCTSCKETKWNCSGPKSCSGKNRIVQSCTKCGETWKRGVQSCTLQTVCHEKVKGEAKCVPCDANRNPIDP